MLKKRIPGILAKGRLNMPPLMTKPSRAAHMAIIYVTIGALLMVWCAVWYAWMVHQGPAGDGQPSKDGWFYVCYAVFFTGLTLFVIGFALGRIGRAGRRAELPPEVSTTHTAQPAITSQPVVPPVAPAPAVVPGQPAIAVQSAAPVARVPPTAPLG
jgi:hypothetical protein